MSKDQRRIKLCKICSKEMLVSPSSLERKKFCSRRCLGLSKVEHLNRTRRSPSEYAKPPVYYGKDNNRWVESVTKVCKQCSQPFNIKPGRIRDRWHTGDFCSFYCKCQYFKEHFNGENSPQWVGGKQTYRGRNWSVIRMVVVMEQEGNCADCGNYVGNSLPVHHRIPFRLFKTAAEANQRDNLIGLCPPCHMKAEN